MEKAFALAVLVTLLLAPAVAQAACSLGANPLSLDARAVPGQTVTAAWNLYNIHGDRITHVRMFVKDSFPGWDITFEPGIHSATYNVTGLIQTIEENLGLEPSEVAGSVPETMPVGMDYVRHPKGEGYIPVRPVKIYVKVPEDAELWKDYRITLEAVGNCFMEPGAVVPGVATQLELNIHTIAEGYSEEEIREQAGTQAEAETGGRGFDITGFLISNASWIGVITVLIILLAYFGFFRNREKWKYSYGQD